MLTMRKGKQFPKYFLILEINHAFFTTISSHYVKNSPENTIETLFL